MSKTLQIRVTIQIDDKEERALSAARDKSSADLTDFEWYLEDKTINKLLKKFIEKKVKSRHAPYGVEWTIFDKGTQVGTTQHKGWLPKDKHAKV